MSGLASAPLLNSQSTTSKNSISDYFQFSHIFLGIFFMSISIINKDFRGLIWITGALFSTIITQIFLKIIGKTKEGDMNAREYYL